MDNLENQENKEILDLGSTPVSEIDYNSFTLDDIDSFRDTYTNVLEANESRANSLSHTLQRIPPAVTATIFV